MRAALDRLSTPVRVAGFVLGLVALFAAALGVGSVVGPSVPAAASAGHDDTAGHGESPDGPESGDGSSQGGHGGQGSAPAVDGPGGLSVSEGGYTLRPLSTTVAAGPRVPVRFAITGPDGAPVTRFDVRHEKLLHLIAVRRDQSGFQHVHPTLAPDGTWSTTLDLTPGTWRLFTDMAPTGAAATTLGADLSVAGSFTPEPQPAQSRTAQVDGYTVTLAGDLVAGQDARLSLRVSRDGRLVTDLDPYLGAYGHLVALRDGDLAYLHVHPDGEPGDGHTAAGPEVVFHTTVPSAGGYRLHLDFQHDGVVRTASFVVTAAGARPAAPAATTTPTTPATGASDGHGH